MMSEWSTVESPRLTGSATSESHFDWLCGLHGDGRVMATLVGVRPPTWTREFLDECMAHWTEHGFGLWVWRVRETGAFVARGGLRRLTLEGEAFVEVAYAVSSEHWGRGYATEIARASADVAFDRLRLPEIVAVTLPTNAGSRRVMEKVGMRYERDVLHAGLPHVLYRLTAPS